MKKKEAQKYVFYIYRVSQDFSYSKDPISWSSRGKNCTCIQYLEKVLYTRKNEKVLYYR